MRRAALVLASSLCLPAHAAPEVAFQNFGMSWARPSTARVSHAEAVAQCASLGPGWRLPTARELEFNWYQDPERTVKHNGFKKAVDRDDIHLLRFWTSDLNAEGHARQEYLEYYFDRRTSYRPASEPAAFACVKGALPTAKAAPKPAASGPQPAVVVPGLTLKSDDFEKREREHQEKVRKDIAASQAQAARDQAQAERRTAQERADARAKAAANYKPCPAGQSCNTSR